MSQLRLSAWCLSVISCILLCLAALLHHIHPVHSTQHAMAAATRKRASGAVSPAVAGPPPVAVDAAPAAVLVVNGKKKRRVAAAGPPLSAVARRRLAAEAEEKSRMIVEMEADKPAAIAAPAPRSSASQNSDVRSDNGEDDEQEYDEDDEDEMEPVASTSRQPYSDLKIYDKAPKRYFLGGGASLDSSTLPSPAADDQEASVIASEGEYIQAGDATSASYTKRPSRRRRRAENAQNFYVDPACTSTWQPSEENCRRASVQDGLSEQIMGLYPGETIVLRGCCIMTVLRGIVSIDCATLTSSSSPVTIMAPSTHALPTIRAVRSSPAQEATHWPYASSEQLEQPIVIDMRSVQTGIEGIESVCRLAGMPIPSGGMWQQPNRWSSAPQDTKDTYRLLLEPERDHCATVIPHNWVEALESVESHPAEGNSTYIVQGPKGVGKSTFSKLLVNTLSSRYTTIAYLDCDLGQPEFTPSGLLSLSVIKRPIIGPSFTHVQHKPTRMHYLGSATPKDDPAFYLWAISDLMDDYATLDDEDGNAIPLVVNTQGWYKGLGADLLLDIHRMTRPGKCFDFAGTSVNAFSAGASVAIVDPSGDTEVINMQPYVMSENAPPRLNAADLRMLQLISYFHLAPSLSAAPSSTATWDFSTSLLAKRPYSVPFSTFTSIKVAVSDSIAFPDLLKALDVSIVGLREEDTHQETDNGPAGVSQSLSHTLYKAYDQGFQQATNHCVGLGLIRAIDNKTQSAHIVTPLSATELDNVNALTKGDIEIPTVMMVDYTTEGGAEDTGLAGVEWKKVPYLEHGENLNTGVGHGRRKVRRNVMRRSQFK